MLPINSALFSSSLSSYILFLNDVLPVLHNCIAGSSSRWSNHLAFGFLHRSTGQTARFMSSSPTSWSYYSAFTSTWRSLCHRLVGWAARCSILYQPTGLWRSEHQVVVNAEWSGQLVGDEVMNPVVQPVDRWKNQKARWHDHLDDDPTIQICRMSST